MKRMTLWIVFVYLMVTMISYGNIAFAQNDANDRSIAEALNDVWWYREEDKALVKVIGKTSTTATLEAPLAIKGTETIRNYSISWWPLILSDILTSDDQKKMQYSDYTDDEPVYTIEGNTMIFTITIDNPDTDTYVTIEPIDGSWGRGQLIEDFKFVLSTVEVIAPSSWGVLPTSVVAWDVYQAWTNQAIANVTCVWDNTANRVTLKWDINTALVATKVQVSHRPNEAQWAMDIKWTPSITDRQFVVNTPHRNIQLFNLKPVDNNGAMIWVEIQYICKPDNGTVSPTNPIPVTPETGPKETLMILLFVSLVWYVLYKKTRKA